MLCLLYRGPQQGNSIGDSTDTFQCTPNMLPQAMGKLLVQHTAWAMTERKWQAFHATISAMRATIMIAKRKAKSLRKQVHKQVRVCGGGKYQKSAGRGKTQKKRRREVRKQRVDGNCEKGPENQTRRAKIRKANGNSFLFWGLSFGFAVALLRV